MKFSLKGILSAVAGLAVATFAGPAVASVMGLSGGLGAIAGGAITGAAGGAVTAALTKQSVGKGALMGAAGGALGGALGSAFSKSAQTVPQEVLVPRPETSAVDIPSLVSTPKQPSFLESATSALAPPQLPTPQTMSNALPLAMEQAGQAPSQVAQAVVPGGTTLLDKFKGMQSSLGFTGKDVFAGLMEATRKDSAVAQAEALLKRDQAMAQAKYQGLADALKQAGYMGYRP